MSPVRLAAALLLSLTLGVLAPRAMAQLPPSSSTTSTPIPGAGHDYLGGQIDTVNPSYGSVSIRIPVIMPPSRGITLPFSFAYDSNGVNYLTPPKGTGNLAFWATTSSVISEAGWSNSAPVISDSLLSWQTLAEDGITKVNCYSLINFVFQDARGSRHNLNLSNYSDPSLNGVCTINSQDWPQGFEGQMVYQGGEGPITASIPTGWSSRPAVSVVDGDGTVFSSGAGSGTWLPMIVNDRNGNTININATYPAPNYTAAFSYIDTNGRTVLQDSGFATNPETVTVSGLAAPYTLTWMTLPTPTFTTPVTNLSGSCTTTHNNWLSTNDNAVSSVTLPNGQSYSFSYDTTYGLVSKVTYPTGGYVRYVWGMNTQAEITNSSNCSMLYGVPALTDRFVSFDGTHEVMHQTFTYTTNWGSPPSSHWASKTTTVTTYDLVRNTNSQTVYTFTGLIASVPPNGGSPTSQDAAESSVAYYDTNGSLLKTVNKTWQNIRLLKNQQTIYPNGQTNETAWNYDSNEMQIEQDDYDFGSGAPGPLMRKTVTTYAPNNSMTTYHVIDKPSRVQVYDGTGSNLVAEADYTYDNPAGSQTTGVVQHSSGCNCGNLTAEARWLNTSGSYLTTSFTNDDTGQRLSMTDPRGNTTTYSYADNYSSGSPSGPTNAYLTQVAYPRTNGVNHIEKFSYAFATGEATTHTDQNNQVTTYKYIDSLSRLTETDFPDGGSTTITYNDSPYNASTPSPSVTTTKKINSSESLVAVSAMDGLGHAIRGEVTSDPQGIIYTDTAYDGLGRAYTVSNPYRSGGDPTTSTGTTTFVYDALGRKCVEVPPDGTAVSGNVCPAIAPAKDLFTQYSGSITTVTDQTGKKRQSATDGLGRLTQVIEDPGGFGYVTNYTSDTLGNLTQVVQNGSHVRTFTYDSLSRLICASNPETSFAPCPSSAAGTYTTGTTGYTYDPDSNLATKTVSTNHSSGTPGSGSSTVNGSEQSLAGAPAVSGTGSVSFSGTLQSTQVLTQPATHATGSVSISGSEQSGNFCDDSGRNCHFKYDLGVVTIYVNGGSYAVSYGRYDTSSTIASNLASALNSSGVVTATASGSTVNITSIATGTSANYSLSASGYTNDPTDFGFASFTPFPSGSTLTGGANAVYTTRYDSGTSTITVNGHGDTVSWSGSGTTSPSIASSLASTINADSGAFVTASASGATVNLTAKAAGASTDYSLSSSYTYDTTDFASSSFTSSNSGGALTGGRDAGATIYDSGSVWITLNGTQYSASYGQSSSSTSLANTLASAINGGSLATAVANGSGITITASSVGTATNYSLSAGSSTDQPGSFSSPSFSISVSGPSLTGGADPGAPLVTTYSYDQLNRISEKDYSDGTPSAFFAYDGAGWWGITQTNTVGRLMEQWTGTSCCATEGAEIFSYDAMGRVLLNEQYTPGMGYKQVTYIYDFAGNTTSVTYPSGRVVNYTYDQADRPQNATDGSNGITYATGQTSPPAGCTSTGVCYTPQGSEYSSAIGKTSGFTGLNFSETYNSRLQPLEIRASSSAGNAIDITYSFVDPNSGGNAGHVYGIANNMVPNRSQNFSYDNLNRIVTAGTSATSGTYCWGYQYNYDAWGNLLTQAGWSPNYNGCSEATMGSVTADGNNHISAFAYDSRGNALGDGSFSYTYDAESQITSAAGVTYGYDARGRRVSKSSGKNYVYDLGGDILAETDGSGNTLNEYIFFGGKRIAMLPSGGSAQYYVEDMLGSSRVMTTNTGTTCYDADFDPFGGEHAYTNSCSQAYKFEGKERDTETGNDDFGARYYTSRFGRWLSADWSSVPVPVPYANLVNPQTLNLYAMVSDDPESFADLDGHAQQASQGPSVYSGDEPSCVANGTGASGNIGSGCGSQAPNLTQDQQQAQVTQQQAQASQQNQRPPQGLPEQQSSATVGVMALGIGGRALAGFQLGGEAGAEGGTVVEPGGGTLGGAVIGAAVGTAVAVLAPKAFSATKDALGKVSKKLDTAIDHLTSPNKMGGPDQDPRRGWRNTVRRNADQMDQLANKIGNKNLANATRFAAQLLRGLAD